MKLVLALLSLMTTNGFASVATPLDVSCIGPENASRFVIYLHGMDSRDPSAQEQRNRAILSQIAVSQNIRFALPRANMPCPTQSNSMCWGWKFDQNELSQILPSILEARAKCFSKDAPFGMIGFSNGGYLLTQWYRKAMKPDAGVLPAYIIASGSDRGAVSDFVGSLESNPPLTLLIGNSDQYNIDPNAGFFNQLRSRGAIVQRVIFDGTHQLDLPSLSSALKSQFVISN